MFSILKKITLLTLFFTFLACHQSSKKSDETPVQGEITIAVDESVYEVVDDVAIVFQQQYPRTKVNLIKANESQIMNLFLSKKVQSAVFARRLNDAENKIFRQKNIIPRTTIFAHDAIAFVTSKKSSIESIDHTKLLSGKSNLEVIVPSTGSSEARFLKDTLSLDANKDTAQLFAQPTLYATFDFVIKNSNSIAAIGVNHLLQPAENIQPLLEKVKVLGIKNDKIVKPNQSDIANKEYPFVRKIYFINFEGKSGLGMGFASFLAGDIGQRIILKSGLVPQKIPTREIIIRNSILN